jgi:hypothetical protein
MSTLKIGENNQNTRPCRFTVQKGFDNALYDEKGKPGVTRGRKAMDPSGTARLPDILQTLTN